MESSCVGLSHDEPRLGPAGFYVGQHSRDPYNAGLGLSHLAGLLFPHASAIFSNICKESGLALGRPARQGDTSAVDQLYRAEGGVDFHCSIPFPPVLSACSRHNLAYSVTGLGPKGRTARTITIT